MTVKEEVLWGIVELMGHKVVAGKLSMSEQFGVPLLRVDVPAVGENPSFTQLYGTSAIYCLTFTSEEVAKNTAERLRPEPVIIYSVRQLEVGDDDPF